jgi:beta-phosphoglucomutase-like phosphatase (HAD superfamily)
VAPSVLLLDIDGTLVDNTRQHIAAWAEAFRALGHPVDEETLRRNLGEGGDLFVKAVAGEEWDRQHGDAARDLHGKAYKRRMSEVRPVPGVTEFLRGLQELEVRPVLASSSNPDEVKANLAVIGETPDHFLIVDKDDIETSKPAPRCVRRRPRASRRESRAGGRGGGYPLGRRGGCQSGRRLLWSPDGCRAARGARSGRRKARLS